jgi:thiol-disulfide isomerase/thioredoxin
VVRPAARRVAALLVGAVLAGCTTYDGPDVTTAPEAAAPAHDAVLVEGGWPEVAAFVREEDRPVVVFFFASWCAPCREETPVIREGVSAARDVAFIGVAHQDRDDAAERFVAEEGLDVLPTVLDAVGATAYEVGARGLPATAFFAADGRLAGVHTGVLTEEVLADQVARLGATVAAG